MAEQENIFFKQDNMIILGFSEVNDEQNYINDKITVVIVNPEREKQNSKWEAIMLDSNELNTCPDLSRNTSLYLISKLKKRELEELGVDTRYGAVHNNKTVIDFLVDNKIPFQGAGGNLATTSININVPTGKGLEQEIANNLFDNTKVCEIINSVVKTGASTKLQYLTSFSQIIQEEAKIIH